jgi:hypothetical protein
VHHVICFLFEHLNGSSRFQDGDESLLCNGLAMLIVAAQVQAQWASGGQATFILRLQVICASDVQLGDGRSMKITLNCLD